LRLGSETHYVLHGSLEVHQSEQHHLERAHRSLLEKEREKRETRKGSDDLHKIL
jgi:hypothetical protein